MNGENHESGTELAIRHLGEARHILSRLITSSESFNYRGAKEALRDLDRKVRELARAQAELERKRRCAESNILTFPGDG